jgi:ATP phosphoribosyltransferase regulatory subunit
VIATARGAGGSGRLRIAVPKGALFEDSVCGLVAAGLDIGTLAEPGRQLIIATEEVEFVISKPTDVPIYVAYGGADCGIAGKDVLVEAGLDVVELADLGFGGCRFVVAGLDGSEVLGERYEHVGVLRVATKYPGIAQAHFDARGVQVELVKLNGNVELAPLIGIADVIVDITATGTTLRQNRLRIIEDVMPSTARFVGNPVAVRTDRRVTEVADALSAWSLESAGANSACASTEASSGESERL